MYDQANELRQLVSQKMTARTSGAARLLVVAGAKGGVGTTAISLQLATAMAHAGFHPVVVDADVDGGNMAMLCEIHERYTIADVLTGRRTVQESLELGPAGVRVLAGAWELAVLAEEATVAQQRLIAQLQGLPAPTDVVVIDVGNGWTRWARRFWQAANAVLLVTTPELPAVMDAYATIKMLSGDDPAMPVELVVNRASDAAVVADVESRLTKACQRFLGIRLGLAGGVPVDMQLTEDSGREGPPGLAGTALGRLAEHVTKRIGLSPAGRHWKAA